jgi:hypothetical protein
MFRYEDSHRWERGAIALLIEIGIPVAAATGAVRILACIPHLTNYV